MKTSETPQNKKGNSQKPAFQTKQEQPFFNGNDPFFKPFVQRKLTIGKPDDPFEKEADEMADKVVQAKTDDHLDIATPPKENNTGLALTSQITPLNNSIKTSSSTHSDINNIQSKCSECEKDEKLQMKEEEEEENSLVQTKIQGSFPLDSGQGISNSLIQFKSAQHESEIGSDLESKLESSKNTGTSLPGPTKIEMENAFGSDFSGVKIHSNASSLTMTKSLGAQAFTHGQDIYFNAGKYKPDNSQGKHLLAHELTHVVQQNSGLAKKSIQKKGDPPVPDQGKTNSAIDYKAVYNANLKHWRGIGGLPIKYINPFKKFGYHPFTTPNAFANETFKLQKFLLDFGFIQDKKKADWKIDGEFTKYLFAELAVIRNISAQDATFKPKMIAEGFPWDVIEQFEKIEAKKTDNPPLYSPTFLSHFYFALINYSSAFILKKDDEGRHVAILQRALEELNYDIGDKGADGKFGDDTEKALKNFQINSGLEGDDADGKLGQQTLRLLDRRFNTVSKQKLRYDPDGDSLLFQVTVPRLMTKEEYLIHTLTYIFNISEDQARILASLPIGKGGWKWNEYTEIDSETLNAGFKRVSVSAKAYREMMGSLSDRFGKGTGSSIEPEMKDLVLKLRGTEKLYELIKSVKSLQSAVDTPIIGDKFDRAQRVQWQAKLKEDLASAIKQRDAELLRLGLTLDVFETDVSAFKETFGKFAAQMALRMLDENEKEASIELIRYGNTDYSEGKEMKTIFGKLKPIYETADKEWWRGISVKEGEDPDKINSYSAYGANYYKKNPMAGMGGPIDFKLIVDGNYGKYRYGEEGPNEHFRNCQLKVIEAHLIHGEAAQKFPILASPNLKIRENISSWESKSPEDIEGALQKHGESVKENIKKTRESIKGNYTQVWELKPVILAASGVLGVVPGSIHETLIKEEMKKQGDDKFWRDIALAVLGITLGLLALASGPLGWAALAGSITVGAIDAYIQYQEITFKKEAARTAFDPAKALSDVDPGYFWFYVSLATIGLDVFQGLKAVKGIAAASKATKGGIEIATEVSEALLKDKKVLQEAMEKAIKEGVDSSGLAKQIKQIDDALLKVDSGEFAKNIDVFKRLSDFPTGVVKLSVGMMVPDIAEAVAKLEKMVKAGSLSDEAFTRILKFYAGPGGDFITELPETMKVLEGSGLARNASAFEDVLTNPRAQKVMLDANDPDAMLKYWKEWGVAKAAGNVKPFSEFLESLGFKGAIKKSGSVLEEFGTEFAKLPNLTKNRQLLQLIEPRLADAFIDGKLPTRLHESLEGILKADLLGKTSDLERAKMRVSGALKALGAGLETPQEYRTLMNLLSDPASRKVVFEAATSLETHKEFAGILATFADEIAKKGAMDDFIRIGPITDPDTVDWLLHNGGIRKLIAENPELIKALKKCASPCFPLLAEKSEIEAVLAAIKGAKDVDFAKLNEFMYANRKPREKWLEAVEALKTDLPGALKSVPKLSAKDIKLPPRWLPEGVTPLKDFLTKVDVLIARGWSPKQLEDIFVQAAINKMDATDFIFQMRRATAHMSKSQLDNISGLINGLSSTKRSRFDMAFYLITKVGDFGHAGGVGMLENIFNVFKLDDLVSLRQTFKYGDDLAKATGEFSGASFEVLSNIASKIDGPREKVLELIQNAGLNAKAGSPDPDILRLSGVLDTMGSGKHTVEAVAAKLEEAKALVAKLKAADDMTELIWGVPKASGKVTSVTGKFPGTGTKAFSSSKVIEFIKGKSGELVESVLTEAGDIDPVKWTKLKEAIENTDLPTATKNHVIGTVLWPKANVEKFLKMGADKVVEEVTIRIKGTNIEAVVDAVVMKGGKIEFKEFKTGLAVLSDNQEKIYKLMKEGRADLLEPAGEKAKQVWPDFSDFSVSEVAIVRD